ncbi:hypothetical protein [Nonomuraea zeae]|uniref:Uncharacterized protein n=1 Tax=Nonomuraea zeae TaxID=1642303 RepID=A0A5S4H389_9ACTN|nr:hypothetical protein [Nonomuraea zeae]TMR39184.1 hypothetical protein ETD85_02095 [Nonomuraea zeae]
MELNVVAPILSAVITSVPGFLAWRAARASAEAAAVLTRIEERRYHHQHAPQLVITCTPQQGETALLTVRLDGPDLLDRVSVHPMIRDDRPVTARPGGVPQEQLDTVIWGPYRFRPGVDDAPPSGREVKEFAIEVGHTHQLLLERTLPPHWAQPAAWRQDYHDGPVLLRLRCASEGFSPWTINAEVRTDGIPFRCA